MVEPKQKPGFAGLLQLPSPRSKPRARDSISCGGNDRQQRKAKSTSFDRERRL
jgi:hypothetical protein